LSLRITSPNHCTWAVRARLPDGHRIRPTIGTYPELSLKKARREARKMLGDIERGGDPTRTKRGAAAERERVKSEPPIKDRLEQWCAAKERDWSERYAAEVKRLAAKVVIPKLGNRLLAEAARADWVGLADELRRRTPAKAHWVYTLVSSFLNHCEAVGWGGENWANPLPRRGRDKIAPALAARARVLDVDELVRLWQASAVLRPRARFRQALGDDRLSRIGSGQYRGR